MFFFCSREEQKEIHMLMTAIKSAGKTSRAIPLEAEEGLGLYSYVHRDPINFTDPLGLQADNPDADGDGEPDPPIEVTARRRFRYFVMDTFTPVLTRHDYTVGSALICNANRSDCSRERVKRKIDSPVCNVPGQTGTGSIKEGTPYRASTQVANALGISVSAGGWVTVAVSNGGFTVTNTTTRVHPFQGSVTRNYFRAANGNWYVTTHGVGNSPLPGMDTLNQVQGPKIFAGVNAACQNHVQSEG